MQRRIALRSRLSIALALGGAVTLVPVFAQPAAQLRARREVPARLRFESVVPHWADGALYGFERNLSAEPLLWRVDGEGTREEVRFSIPGASSIQVRGVTPGPDGALVVVGGAVSADSKGATIIAWIAPDRKRQTIIRVWPYVADAAAVSSDGVIWAVGFLKDEDNTRAVAQNVLRRYDQSGKLLGSVAVHARSVWRDDDGDAVEGSYLMASRDRVGWFTNGNEYIEFSLSGTEVGRYQGPPNLWIRRQLPNGVGADQRPCGAGLSQNGAFYVCRPGKPSAQILALDRERRTWHPLSLEMRPGDEFAGTDGDAPIIARYGNMGTIRRYTWNASEAGK